MLTHKEQIYNFIKTHQLAVLSTVNSAALPESALIGFSENPKLELFFGTLRDSRKYANLIKNPRVALVIGWEHGKTVQYEGSAEELHGEEKELVRDNHFQKIPSVAEKASHPYQAFFKVKPHWIKYTDISKTPWDTFEIVLEN